MEDARNAISRRRIFLKAGGAVIATYAATSVLIPAGAVAQAEPQQETKIPPTEDLMREHGVLRRVLLIYAEAVRRIDADQEMDPKVITSSAQIVRRFIEDYHEKLEEDYLFPRFKKADKHVNLVQVLLQQHRAGRRVTEDIMRLATPAGLRSADDRRRLTDSIRMFTRMYQPHAAREDTVLFPTMRSIVSPHEFDSLGEEFEKKENQLFGEDGFEKTVHEVELLEKQLGIYDLAQFTPR